MKFHSSFNGFDLFETVNNNSSTFTIVMDTPDGNLPVGRGYSSVEEAHQAIKTGWAPSEPHQPESLLKKALNLFAK